MARAPPREWGAGGSRGGALEGLLVRRGRKGGAGGDWGGCTVRWRGGLKRVPAAGGCFLSPLATASLPTPLARAPGEWMNGCWPQGALCLSVFLFFARSILMTPSSCPRPPPSPLLCAGRVSLCAMFFLGFFFFFFLPSLLFSGYGAPRGRPFSLLVDRNRNDFVRDLRQIDVAGAAVPDTVPLEVLAAVDRGRNPEAVTKDTLYVRARVRGRYFRHRWRVVAVGWGGGGVGVGLERVTGACHLGRCGRGPGGEMCAFGGGGGCGLMGTFRMGSPFYGEEGGRSFTVWFAALWQRRFWGWEREGCECLVRTLTSLFSRPPALVLPISGCPPPSALLPASVFLPVPLCLSVGDAVAVRPCLRPTTWHAGKSLSWPTFGMSHRSPAMPVFFS